MKDLIVEQIQNVYYSKTAHWRRKNAKIRQKDGIVLFVEGEIEYVFPDRRIVASPGKLLFLPGNVPYSGISHTETVAYFVVNFESHAENALAELGAPCALEPQDREAIYSAFSSALEAWSLQRLDAHFGVKSLLYTALAELAAEQSRVGAESVTSAILAYIASHYTDVDISVSQLCERFFISESQLRRNLLKATGLSTNEYITSLRLNRAKRELICTDKSVEQIAAECGFASPYYFSRCFHQHTSLSPREYRRSNLML